jgi:Outer membrane protein and related peptidoglycan-associated (lipo)proteins
MKKVLSILLAATLVFSVAGCSSWSKTANGGLIGGGAGAAIGAGIGILLGGDAQSAAIGAAVGAGVGGGAGAIIGNRMDKKAEELAAALEDVKIEDITDVNGFRGKKYTFDGGILFGFNSSNLSDGAKEELKKFADIMKSEPVVVTIYGHTDNVGTEEANQKVSAKRADAVASYLKKCGMDKDNMISRGMSFTMPVASNDTEEGRAQNRRVEIYITPSEEMLKEAEAQI